MKRSSYRPIVLHRRIMVNLVDGSAMNGVLWDERAGLLVLRDAWLHVPGASDPTHLDGEIVIDRQRIAFVQVNS